MRIFWVKTILLFFLFAICIRLFYWQVVRAEFLQSQAENQHYKNTKIEAVRGNILFADGSILTSSNPAFSLYGLPKQLDDEQKVTTAYLLAKVLTGKQEEVDGLAKEITNKLSQDLYWVLLKRNISPDQKKQIEQLNLKGVEFEGSSVRFYPEGSSAAHLLGFVVPDTKDAGASKGYFGLEGYFNGELKGISGLLRNERDALGLPILIGNFLESQASNGKSLILNVNQTVQFIVEESLRAGIKKYGAKSGSVVVMDPKTGGILALAAYPSYDPLTYYDFPKEYFRNPIVADQYEPGSTFKVLVLAAALNEGLIRPDTKCDICSGPVSISGFTIRTWNNKYYADTTMKDVIVHSDNTGMVFAGKKIGLDKFYSYLENFGFGQPTNIDLQDEASPDIRVKEAWREIDLATASFGQGIAVTPVQMVRAISAIANGGNLMEPHVVSKVLSDDGKSVYEIKPKSKQVLKPAVAQQVMEMMVAAVEEGESKFVKPKGFKIAGKTGTAQIPVAGHYDPNKTIASFVGFAPADDPKFVMLVRYDEPSSSIFGSETAAPTFFEIAKQLLLYYKIAPSE
ncbi:MAG: Peptidoglycan glycosyltransferase [Candidatus Daviesbacteria bacterium GW2011_GWB1_39_5]|nr:MAG: Peptidoglycan glycosyltransferase [Candidatus Daviesbacteria bacterium GW2011_GWB1_39_5]